MTKNIISLSVVIFCLAIASQKCRAQSGELKKADFQLKLIGEKTILYNQDYQQTIIGGLSGIDYDSINKLYYLISDDRSAKNPARYYTAKISFNTKAIDTVIFTKVTYLKQKNGKDYPNSRQDKYHVPDPEALRKVPGKDEMIWSSEGERIVKPHDTVLIDPSVQLINEDGSFISQYSTPSYFKMQAVDKGPRQNGTFEGLTFSPNNQYLWVSLEVPRYEDGSAPDTKAEKRYCRFIKFNRQTKKAVAQFAYPLDPVAEPPLLPGTFMINGIPDILALNDHQFLVLERSYSLGKSNTIKLYLANLDDATDVSDVDSLMGNNDFQPMSKKLILNFNSLDTYIDNIEGVTFGPVLPDGHRTLLFVSDNNFSGMQQTQFWAFEIL